MKNFRKAPNIENVLTGDLIGVVFLYWKENVINFSKY